MSSILSFREREISTARPGHLICAGDVMERGNAVAVRHRLINIIYVRLFSYQHFIFQETQSPTAIECWSTRRSSSDGDSSNWQRLSRKRSPYCAPKLNDCACARLPRSFRSNIKHAGGCGSGPLVVFVRLVSGIKTSSTLPARCCRDTTGEFVTLTMTSRSVM